MYPRQGYRLTIDDAHRALVLLGTIIAHECHEYSIIKEVQTDALHISSMFAR